MCNLAPRTVRSITPSTPCATESADWGRNSGRELAAGYTRSLLIYSLFFGNQWRIQFYADPMSFSSSHTSHTDGNTMPPQRTLTAPTNAITRNSQYPPPDAPDPAYSSTPYTMPNAYPTIPEQNDTSSGASSYPRGSYQQASPASNYHSPNRSPQSYTRTISPPVNVPSTTLHNSFPNETIFGPSGKPKKSGVACDECRKKKVGSSPVFVQDSRLIM